MKSYDSEELNRVVDDEFKKRKVTYNLLVFILPTDISEFTKRDARWEDDSRIPGH